MRRGLLVAILLFFAIQFQLKAQEIIVILHPLVGATIDKIEMDKYQIFTDYRNPDIEYFIVNTHNEIINLIGMKEQQVIFRIEIGTAYFSVQRENIEKLNKYYTSLPKNDSTSLIINRKIHINNEALNVNQKIVTPELIKSIKESKRQKQSQEQTKENEINRSKGFRNK